jgi:hypothetical protein
MNEARKRTAGLLTLAMMASACSDLTQQPNYEPENTVLAPSGHVEAAGRESDGQPIRVGESGPRFPACSSTGQVVGASQEDPLEVRNAPFERSQLIDALSNGQKLYICMNSLDRKWFGVIYAREGQELAECGVARPTKVAGEYSGPCHSGWVSSAFIRLGAS